MDSGLITVAIVEDDAVIRNSLVRLVGEAPGFRCVGSCATGEEALEKLPALKPAAVVMDVNLPRMSGIECTRRFRALSPSSQVMMLTVYADGEHLFSALKAGASGYLLKRSDPDEVLQALRDVAAGGAPMTGQIARRVVQSFRDEPAGSGLGADVKLTEREEEILARLSKGYANKEIADQLSISVPTVRTHLRHIYEKLHVRSRTEAVAKFLR